MKKSDIKRLEKVTILYQQIEDLLDKSCDSIENGKTEYVVFGGNAPEPRSVWKLVSDMRDDARLNKQWIEARVRMFKEQLTIK